MTTTGSNKAAYYLDVLTTDSTKLDESTATTVVANYMTVSVPGSEDSCVDPEDTTRIYVVAAETQLVGAATATTA